MRWYDADALPLHDLDASVEDVYFEGTPDQHTCSNGYLPEHVPEAVGTGDLLLALEALTEKQRFVVRAYYVYGLSLREIAALTTWERKTVWQHLQAGLARLRVELDTRTWRTR